MSAVVLPLTQPDEGWVYVIDNPSMPRMCKVGMTTRTPEERAAELHDTGSPTPYRVFAAWQVPDVRRGERDAHAVLDRFRTTDQREWFAMPADQAAVRLDRLFNVAPTHRRRPWRMVRGIVEGFGWLMLIATVSILVLQ